MQALEMPIPQCSFTLLSEYMNALDMAAVIVTYPELRYAYSNTSNCRWLSSLGGPSFTPQDLIGLTVDEVVADQGKELLDIVRQAGRTGQKQILDPVKLNLDGETRYHKIVYFPLLGEDGAVTHVAGISTDITDTINAERRCSTEFKARYDSLGRALDSMDTAMVVLTYPDLRYQYLNSQSCQNLSQHLGRDITEDEILGLSYAQVYKSLDQKIVAEAVLLLKKAGESRVPQICEPAHICSTDGKRHYTRTVYSPVIDNGSVSQIVVTSIDVTNIVKAQKDIEELSQAKDELLSMCSHELKTPLTVLLANLELLLMTYSKLDERQRQKTLVKLVTQAKKMDRLIGDLLDFSRLSTGKLEVNPKPVSIGKLLVQMTANFRSNCQTHVIDLVTPLDCMVSIDPVRIEQVLTNLLSNAVRYSPRSSAITIGMDTDDKWVRIRITDTGQGISEADMTRLFERYYQSSQASEKHGGMGLGLYISNEIIKLHNGRLSVSSKLGEGSTFTVELPR